jgi:hypothetical protein
MLVGLPQRVGGVAISLFHVILVTSRTRCLYSFPKGLTADLFDLILVYLYNTQQVLVGLPQGAILSHFSLAISGVFRGCETIPI